MDVCVQAAKQCSGLLKVLKMMMLEMMMMMVVVLLNVLKMMMMVLLLMVLKMMMVMSLTGEALFGSLFGIFLNIC